MSTPAPAQARFPDSGQAHWARARPRSSATEALRNSEYLRHSEERRPIAVGQDESGASTGWRGRNIASAGRDNDQTGPAGNGSPVYLDTLGLARSGGGAVQQTFEIDGLCRVKDGDYGPKLLSRRSEDPYINLPQAIAEERFQRRNHRRLLGRLEDVVSILRTTKEVFNDHFFGSRRTTARSVAARSLLVRSCALRRAPTAVRLRLVLGRRAAGKAAGQHHDD